MKKMMLGLLLLALPIGAANAQTMNAQNFHQRATALQKKGALAIFSRSEIRALMGEGKAAGAKARELRLKAIAAGQKSPYCPPEAAVGIDSTEFMNRLSAIPAAERAKINMTQAMTRILAAKYPCSR